MKTMRDLYNNQDVVSSLVPALRTADANGTGVDLLNFDGAMLNVHVGAPGDTLSGSVRIEFTAEESDDNSTFAAVADADLVGAVTGGVATGTIAIVDANGEANTTYQVGYRGTKRYVRVVENRVGTHTNGTPTSASVVRGFPRIASIR